MKFFLSTIKTCLIQKCCFKVVAGEAIISSMSLVSPGYLIDRLLPKVEVIIIKRVPCIFLIFFCQQSSLLKASTNKVGIKVGLFNFIVKAYSRLVRSLEPPLVDTRMSVHLYVRSFVTLRGPQNQWFV